MSGLIAPIAFVVIWSTGFMVAKAAIPHADMQFYVSVRLALTFALMTGVALSRHARWPRFADVLPHAVAGALMQGLYLCLSYWSMTHGMAAGIMALLGALQPLFTALYLALVPRKHLGARVWSGLLIGFAGVTLVLVPRLADVDSTTLSVASVVVALMSVVVLTAGSLVQKWLLPIDLWAAASLQSLGGLVVAVVMTILFGAARWDGSGVLWFALIYAVLIPSMVATTLLMWMLRHGEATRVTSLILLVPPLALLQAWFFFGETLVPMQIAGTALALGGVVLARMAPSP